MKWAVLFLGLLLSAGCGSNDEVLFLTVANSDGEAVKDATVTLYGSFEDWAAQSNPLESGSPDSEGAYRSSNSDVGELSEVWVDVVDNFNTDNTNWDFSNFEDSNIKHAVDPEVSTTATLYNNSFYDGLVGIVFVVTGQTVNGVDGWSMVSTCSKDNTLTLNRNFSAVWDEGSDKCTEQEQTRAHEFMVDRTYTEAFRFVFRDPTNFNGVRQADYSDASGTLMFTDIVDGETVVTTYAAQ